MSASFARPTCEHCSKTLTLTTYGWQCSGCRKLLPFGTVKNGDRVY